MCDISEMIDSYHEENGITKLEASERMGIDYSTYKRKTNQYDKYELTAKEIIPFTRAHNMDFRLLNRIERRLGRVAFTIPEKDEEINLQSISKLANTSGKALSTMAESLEDGIITSEERIALNDALLALNQRVNIIMGKLNK